MLVFGSMWLAVSQVLANLLQTVVTTFFGSPCNPGNAGCPVSQVGGTLISHSTIVQLAGFLNVMGIWVNLGVLFGCIAAILLWKLGWAAINVYYRIVDLVPVLR